MENNELIMIALDELIKSMNKLGTTLYEILQNSKIITSRDETITVVRKGTDEVVARLFKNENGEWLGICSDDFEII